MVYPLPRSQRQEGELKKVRRVRWPPCGFSERPFPSGSWKCLRIFPGKNERLELKHESLIEKMIFLFHIWVILLGSMTIFRGVVNVLYRSGVA